MTAAITFLATLAITAVTVAVVAALHRRAHIARFALGLAVAPTVVLAGFLILTRGA